MKYSVIVIMVCIAFISGIDQAIAANASIKSIKGKVFASRKGHLRGDKKPQKEILLQEGSRLYIDDQLFVDKKSEGKISCPEKRGISIHTIPEAEWTSVRERCGNYVSSNIRPGMDESVIGGIDDTIPYLITPRHTLLLNDRPKMRWNAVAGAKEYTVSLLADGKPSWEKVSTKNELQYDGPKLIPGVSYAFIITTDTGVSSTRDRDPKSLKLSKNLDFRIMRSEEVSTFLPKDLSDIDAILRTAKAYREYRIPENRTNLYKLNLYNYTSYGLMAEAVQILEAYLLSNKDSRLTRLALAEMYLELGLLKLAEKNFLMVIEGANRETDFEEQLKAHSLLGLMYEKYFKDTCKAIFYYEKAASDFTSIEDSTSAQNYQESANSIKKNIRPGVCVSQVTVTN